MFVFEQDKKLKINTVDNDPNKANIVIESTSDGKAKITMDGEELTPGGGGGGMLVVNVTEEDGVFHADKTLDEVGAAFPNVVATFEGMAFYAEESMAGAYCVFSHIWVDVGNGVVSSQITIEPNNQVRINDIRYPE